MKQIILKTLNSFDGRENGSCEDIQMRMSREYLKLKLYASDRDYLKYLSYKNILKRIKGE